MNRDCFKKIVKETISSVVKEMTCTGAVGAISTPYAFSKKKKKKVYEGTDDDMPLYVQYDSERTNEEPFEINGQRYQFVNAIYPNGKKDIGVYVFGQDMVYGYEAFRKMHNIKEQEQPESYDDATDSFSVGPRQRPENWESHSSSQAPDKKLLQWAIQRFQRENNPNNREVLLKVIKMIKSDLGL